MHKHIMPKELDKNSRVLYFGKKKDKFSIYENLRPHQ
tara:strand:+ start:396 stop:506 length:111 start_codon:yes stop_codon:yes gene_type:complete